MKIHFSIENKNIADFLLALQYAGANSPQKDSLGFIQDIIKQIKVGLIIRRKTIEKLKNAIEKYTDGSPILITSDFRTQLGLSGDFINDDRGLIAMLNNVLTSIQEKYKPGSNINLINKNTLDDVRTIDDLINIIITNYEKS